MGTDKKVQMDIQSLHDKQQPGMRALPKPEDVTR